MLKHKTVIIIQVLCLLFFKRGDIEGFMLACWKSEDLQFGGASGITWGWQQSENVVSLTGSWELERAADRPGGYFQLIWRKIEGEWKIVVDHTSQKPLAKKEKKSFQSLELIKEIYNHPSVFTGTKCPGENSRSTCKQTL